MRLEKSEISLFGYHRTGITENDSKIIECGSAITLCVMVLLANLDEINVFSISKKDFQGRRLRRQFLLKLFFWKPHFVSMVVWSESRGEAQYLATFHVPYDWEGGQQRTQERRMRQGRKHKKNATVLLNNGCQFLIAFLFLHICEGLQHVKSPQTSDSHPNPVSSLCSAYVGTNVLVGLNAWISGSLGWELRHNSQWNGSSDSERAGLMN